MQTEVLDFKGCSVRMAMKDGEPWWVVADVCSALGIGNPTDATKRVDKDDLDLVEVIDAIGRKQKSSVVNEPGLYSLILRSEKPEAKVFKQWLTHEVLPALRKTGTYTITTETPRNKYAVMRQMVDALEAHETRIATLETRMDLLGADTHYRTVRGYCNEKGITMPEKRARAIGVQAAALCREQGLEIGDVADERHGTVHSYPIAVIEQAMESSSFV